MTRRAVPSSGRPSPGSCEAHRAGDRAWRAGRAGRCPAPRRRPTGRGPGSRPGEPEPARVLGRYPAPRGGPRRRPSRTPRPPSRRPLRPPAPRPAPALSVPAVAPPGDRPLADAQKGHERGPGRAWPRLLPAPPAPPCPAPASGSPGRAGVPARAHCHPEPGGSSRASTRRGEKLRPKEAWELVPEVGAALRSGAWSPAQYRRGAGWPGPGLCRTLALRLLLNRNRPPGLPVPERGGGRGPGHGHDGGRAVGSRCPRGSCRPGLARHCSQPAMGGGAIGK